MWSRRDLLITGCVRGDVENLQQSVLSGSDISSESEFIEEEKPWPPSNDADRSSRPKNKGWAPRLPRPHSHLFMIAGRARASKHTRRWENSMYLSSLYNIPEDELAEESILPVHDSPFSRLHTSDKNMQIWCSFSANSEEDQDHMTLNKRNQRTAEWCCDHDNLLPGEAQRRLGVGKQQREEKLSAEWCMRRIDPRIRTVFQHNRHLPMTTPTSEPRPSMQGLLYVLEQELSYMFSVAGSYAVVLLLQTNSFCRLLLHGISQYLGLKSSTENVGGVEVVVVECERRDHFTLPAMLLSIYLQSK